MPARKTYLSGDVSELVSDLFTASGVTAAVVRLQVRWPRESES